MDLGHNFADGDFHQRNVYLGDVDFRMWQEMDHSILSAIGNVFRNGFENIAFRTEASVIASSPLKYRKMEFTMGAILERLWIYTPRSREVLFTNIINVITDAALIHYRFTLLPLYNSERLLYNSIRRRMQKEIAEKGSTW